MLRAVPHALISLLVLTGCTQMQDARAPIEQAQPKERWVVYYGNRVSKDVLAPYDLVVLEPEFFADIRPYRSPEQTMLGYISIAEIHPGRSYAAPMRERDTLVGENNEWDTYTVDVRKDAWRKYVLDALIPYVLERSFDGIMLDTIDSITAMEQGDPVANAGMTDAFISLLAEMRQRYPDLYIMANRGIEMVERMAPTIDSIIAESVFIGTNIETGKHAFVPQHIYREIAARLQKTNLPVYTLDYWDIKKPSGLHTIYATQRANGFVPYVTTLDLSQIHNEAGKAQIIYPEATEVQE